MNELTDNLFHHSSRRTRDLFTYSGSFYTFNSNSATINGSDYDYENKVISHTLRKKQSKKKLLKVMKLKGSSSSVNSPKNKKTAFTKNKEKLFKDMFTNSPLKNNNYGKGMCYDRTPVSPSRNNKLIVKNFLERQVQANKKTNARRHSPCNKEGIKIIKLNKNNNIKPPNQSSMERKKKLINFIDNQKLFVERKNKNLERLKGSLEKDRKQLYWSIPKVNRYPPQFNNQNRKECISNGNSPKYNVFEKLYNNSGSKKRNLIQEKAKNKIITIPNPIDEATYNRLMTRSASRDNSPRNEPNFIIAPNGKSNEIILKKLLNSLNTILEQKYNLKYQDNKELIVDEVNYNDIINKLGFLSNKNSTDNTVLLPYSIKIIRALNGKDDGKIIGNSILLFLGIVINIFQESDINLLPKYLTPHLDRLKTKTLSIGQIKQIRKQFIGWSNSYYSQLGESSSQNKKNEDSQKTENNISPFSFKPISYTSNRDALVNSLGKRYNVSNSKSFCLGNVYEKMQQRRDRFINKINQENNEIETYECSFSPKGIAKQSTHKSKNEMNRFDLLYLDGKKINNKINLLKEEYKKFEPVFSYGPILTEYNSEMFRNNPIQNNAAEVKRIKSYEKARNEKLKKNTFGKYGWTSKSLAKEGNDKERKMERIGNFRFTNEKVSNKDGFDKFKKGNENPSSKIYTFNIIINNNLKVLYITVGEDIAQKVSQFCKNNSLNKEIEENIGGCVMDKYSCVDNNKT